MGKVQELVGIGSETLIRALQPPQTPDADMNGIPSNQQRSVAQPRADHERQYRARKRSIARAAAGCGLKQIGDHSRLRDSVA